MAVAALRTGSRRTAIVELSDIVEPESARMRARGKAPGSAVDVRTEIRLVELGPNLTRLDWSAETDFSGTVASVGARLLQGTARKLTEQFWEEFARQVARRET
jgi:carbon monoxide dehydrogenase subunit G